MNNIHVVLVGSKYPRNIGMVSRILCNFGVERLILIGPQCELNEEARQGAAQGQKPLREQVTYDSWSEFTKKEAEGPRIAFSRRQGKRRLSQPLHEIFEWENLKQGRPIYLVFGSEDNGLDTEDLEYCHRICYFDIPGPLKSMNLSHAVLMAIQAFYSSSHIHQTKEDLLLEPIELPEKSLRAWLEALEFDLDSQNRWNALVMLNQLILRAGPSPDEIHSLDMIIQQTLRRLNEKHGTLKSSMAEL